MLFGPYGLLQHHFIPQKTFLEILFREGKLGSALYYYYYCYYY